MPAARATLSASRTKRLSSAAGPCSTVSASGRRKLSTGTVFGEFSDTGTLPPMGAIVGPERQDNVPANTAARALRMINVRLILLRIWLNTVAPCANLAAMAAAGGGLYHRRFAAAGGRRCPARTS